MKRLIAIIRNISKEVSNANVAVYSANAAFFLLLSVFPALLFLISVTQYTVVSMDVIFDFISPIIPEVLLPLAQYVVDDLSAINPVGILSMSTVFLLWSASKGVYGLVKGLNQAMHLRETRPYWKVRIVCVFYTAAVLAVLLITVILYTVSQNFLLKIFTEGSFLHRLLSTILDYRWFVAGVILTIGFTLIYLFFPCKRSRLRAVLPGSLGSAAGWVIFSSLFSYYVRTASRASSVYGSISVIALTMLWLYFCMNILFFGAMLNHYLSEHRKQLAQWFAKP